MKVERIYTEEVPIWKCNTHNCGFYFHLEGFSPNVSMSWGNREVVPYCPRCGYKNCEIATGFPEFSDE